MALSTSNVRKAAMGPFKVTAGDWTGNVGDASGTVTVEGGRVYAAIFNQNGATPTQDIPCTWTAPTGTTATTTINVHNRENATAGTFIVIHA